MDEQGKTLELPGLGLGPQNCRSCLLDVMVKPMHQSRRPRTVSIGGLFKKRKGSIHNHAYVRRQERQTTLRLR